jgi:uncharacterized repeat protein (TIGR01451 family)
MRRRALAIFVAALTAPLPLLAQDITKCPRIPHDPHAGEWFGFALAADAGRLAVGAPGDPGRSPAGAAYVVRRDAAAESGWSREDTSAVRSGGPGDRFGVAVALRGERLAVGAPGGAAGAVYLFSREAGGWRPESLPRVVASNGNRGDRLGAAVALSADTLVVGAPGDGERGSLAGAVYVFRRTGSAWDPPQKLLAPDSQSADALGSAVAIDGDTLVAGAPFADELPHRRNFGAVYVFERRDGVWRFSRKLTAEPFEEDDVRFGASVALSSGRLVVGAPGEDRGGADRGVGYVFSRSDWTRISQAPEGRGNGDQLGSAVAIDVDAVVLGAPLHRVGGERPGTVFVDDGRIMTAESAAADSQFGAAVALLNGAMLLGGFRDDDPQGGAVDAGAVAFCPAANPLGVDLRVTGAAAPSPVVKGRLLTWRWVVKNVGSTRATGVRLLSGPAPVDLGALEPGDTREVVLPFRVPACYTGPVPLVRRAEVKANEPDLHPADDTAAVASDVLPAIADVAVTAEILDSGGASLPRGARVEPGERVTYRITVDNRGPGTACGVVLSNSLPAGLIPVAPFAPCLLIGQCPLGALRKDEPARILEASFEVCPVASCPARLESTATIASQGSIDPEPANDASGVAVTVGVGPGEIPALSSLGGAVLALLLAAGALLRLRARRSGSTPPPA